MTNVVLLPTVVMSASGLGCVKTPKSNLRLEISSRLPQFKKRNRGNQCLESTAENAVLRVPRARTFLHSLGHQRPFRHVRYESADTLRADSNRTSRHFAFGPKAAVSRCSKQQFLFDHLVCPQQGRCRQCHTDDLGCFQVKREFEIARLLDW